MSTKRFVTSIASFLTVIVIGLGAAAPAHAEGCGEGESCGGPGGSGNKGWPTCPAGQTCPGGSGQDSCDTSLEGCLALAIASAGFATSIAVCDAKYVLCEKYGITF